MCAKFWMKIAKHLTRAPHLLWWMPSWDNNTAHINPTGVLPVYSRCWGTPQSRGENNNTRASLIMPNKRFLQSECCNQCSGHRIPHFLPGTHSRISHLIHRGIIAAQIKQAAEENEHLSPRENKCSKRATSPRSDLFLFSFFQRKMCFSS